MGAKILALGVALAVVLSAERGDAKGPETFPLEQVKRGQKGYGMTTFQGAVPGRFEFEVIGIVKNFLPKLDIILVKSDDKKLEITGFWQGMSGSPLYIDGKLVCAFSYGFRFNKVSIGGCTPIEYMKREGFQKPRRAKMETEPISGAPKKDRDRPPRIVQKQSRSTFADWLEVAPNGSIDQVMRRVSESPKGWLLGSPRIPVPAMNGGAEASDLVPAAIPLTLSGFSGPAFERVKQLFANHPFTPVRGGGTGSATEGPGAFQMGGSIAVHLIRGDMAAAGTGTVSYIDGSGVLAFGHPMFQAGELYAPVSTADVHTVIPSMMSAFVLASPNREIGTLIHDRKSTISADTSLRTRMVPVDIRVKMAEGQGESGTFKVEVLNDQFFTSTLAQVAAMDAAGHFVPDRDNVTAKISSKVVLRNRGELAFVDYLNSRTGAMGLIIGARGLRALAPLLLNPFEPVEIERVELDIEASYDSNFGDIVGLRLLNQELSPGATEHVYVDMTTFNGARITEKVAFRVPPQLAGSVIRLEVTAGDAATLDAAPPESLDDLISSLKKLLPGDTFAVTLYTAEEGVAIAGKVVRDMPPSAVDRMKSSTATENHQPYQSLYRSLSKSKRVINGSQSLLVRIADKPATTASP